MISKYLSTFQIKYMRTKHNILHKTEFLDFKGVDFHSLEILEIFIQGCNSVIIHSV